jgi:hypothetical protein
MCAYLHCLRDVGVHHDGALLRRDDDAREAEAVAHKVRQLPVEGVGRRQLDHGAGARAAQREGAADGGLHGGGLSGRVGGGRVARGAQRRHVRVSLASQRLVVQHLHLQLRAHGHARQEAHEPRLELQQEAAVARRAVERAQQQRVELRGGRGHLRARRRRRRRVHARRRRRRLRRLRRGRRRRRRRVRQRRLRLRGC